jgi:hypothetical protein
MGGFILAALLIVGFVSWRANELLTTQAVEALTAEVGALRRQFEAGGASRLNTAINERVAEPGSNLYLLVDAARRKLAGNLSAMPPELDRDGEGGVFTYLRGSEQGAAPQQRLAVGLPLALRCVQTRVVGRVIEDQRRFAGTIGRVALWSVGLLSALGVGAGMLISRSMLAHRNDHRPVAGSWGRSRRRVPSPARVTSSTACRRTSTPCSGASRS